MNATVALAAAVDQTPGQASRPEMLFLAIGALSIAPIVLM